MTSNSLSKKMVTPMIVVAVAVCFAGLWYAHGVETAVIEVLAAANFLWLWHNWKEPVHRFIMVFAAVVLFAISVTIVSYAMSLIVVSLALLVLFSE